MATAQPDQAQLQLDGVVLDDSRLTNTPVLPYLRMMVSLIEARLLTSIARRGIETPLEGVDPPQGRFLLNGFKRYRCAQVCVTIGTCTVGSCFGMV
ncbi:MAG TPA: hypothetical protein VMV69_28000 [Pirellulales bacterium]|nr:hypothetical protein [Pirellulales bacterium]